jgi:hypothetical protein
MTDVDLGNDTSFYDSNVGGGGFAPPGPPANKLLDSDGNQLFDDLDEELLDHS